MRCLLRPAAVLVAQAVPGSDPCAALTSNSFEKRARSLRLNELICFFQVDTTTAVATVATGITAAVMGATADTEATEVTEATVVTVRDTAVTVEVRRFVIYFSAVGGLAQESQSLAREAVVKF